jgi:hypothetical protein
MGHSPNRLVVKKGNNNPGFQEEISSLHTLSLSPCVICNPTVLKFGVYLSVER